MRALFVTALLLAAAGLVVATEGKVSGRLEAFIRFCFLLSPRAARTPMSAASSEVHTHRPPTPTCTRQAADAPSANASTAGTVAVTDDALPYLSTRPAQPDWAHIRTRTRTPTLAAQAWVSGGDAAPPPADDPRFAQSATPDWVAGASNASSSADPDTPKFLGGSTRITFDDSRVPGMLAPTDAAGKLFICAAASGGTCMSAWVCSAALIGKGLLLTAAHCVWDYGRGPAFTKINGAIEVWFTPAKNGASNPYGAFRATTVLVPQPFAAGTDTCATGAAGIVCNNDLALIALDRGGLNAAAPVLAGDAVGSFLGIGVNNYGAGVPRDASVSPGVRATFGTKASTMVAQLGYPAYIDAGNIMQASFSPAHVYTATSSGTTTGRQLRQLVKATTMGGGASGGPWVVNLGVRGSGGVYGLSSAAARNVIVCVSSWGYVSSTADISAIAMFGCSTMGVNSCVFFSSHVAAPITISLIPALFRLLSFSHSTLTLSPTFPPPTP